MNIAVVGSSGYIAKFLLKSFFDNEAIEKVLKIDQTDDADVYLDLLKPSEFDYGVLNDVDYVVFTAAVSGPDKCATEFETCWAVNVIGTRYFIEEAIKRNCRVLFFSSDAVFGDRPGEIYTENSETCAETPYGKMKKAIEDEFKSEKNFKAIRLSYVVSAEDRFVSYCLNCVRTNEIADVFHPFYRNCIVVSDVVRVVVWLLNNWEKYKLFVLNIAGQELVSRLRIADELNRLMRGRLQYKVSMPGAEFYRNRPAITQMKSLYLEQYEILEKETFTEKILREITNEIIEGIML